MIALRANTIVSLIAALISKRSFCGGAFSMCSRIRSMIAGSIEIGRDTGECFPDLAQVRRLHA